MPESGKPESGATAHNAGAVDIERLADRVYRLMLAELQLERSRGGGMDP